MASLMDLANVSRSVDVDGIKVDVWGISGQSIAKLMVRFPAIGQMVAGKNPSTEEIMKLAPEALAAVIAAGCGKEGDKEAEKLAGMLAMGPQLDLIDEILRRTFPKGVRPFAAKLEGLGTLVALDAANPQTKQSQEQPKS